MFPNPKEILTDFPILLRPRYSAVLTVTYILVAALAVRACMRTNREVPTDNAAARRRSGSGSGSGSGSTNYGSCPSHNYDYLGNCVTKSNYNYGCTYNYLGYCEILPLLLLRKCWVLPENHS